MGLSGFIGQGKPRTIVRLRTSSCGDKLIGERTCTAPMLGKAV